MAWPVSKKADQWLDGGPVLDARMGAWCLLKKGSFGVLYALVSLPMKAGPPHALIHGLKEEYVKAVPSSKLEPRYHIAVKLSGDTWTAPDLAGGFTSKRELVASDIAQRIVKQAKEHRQEVIIMRSEYHSPLVTPEDWDEEV